MLLMYLRTYSLAVSGTEARSYIRVSGPSARGHLHWACWSPVDECGAVGVTAGFGLVPSLGLL